MATKIYTYNGKTILISDQLMLALQHNVSFNTKKFKFKLLHTCSFSKINKKLSDFPLTWDIIKCYLRIC